MLNPKCLLVALSLYYSSPQILLYINLIRELVRWRAREMLAPQIPILFNALVRASRNLGPRTRHSFVGITTPGPGRLHFANAMTSVPVPDDAAAVTVAGPCETTAVKSDAATPESAPEPPLPPLSPAEFELYNSMASKMEYFVSPLSAGPRPTTISSPPTPSYIRLLSPLP